MSIPFDTIASSLLSRADSLLPEWFPAGKRSGGEFTIGNLRGDAGKSLSINTRTGVWKDFSGDEGGADLISLYAAIHGLSQADAARHLAPHLANGHDHAAITINQRSTAPIPTARPEPPEAPGATALYRYTDLFYVARFDKADGSKVFTPFTHDGSAWHRKSHAKPRPLYGLDELAARPDAPVLLVEGEKTAHAAAAALGAYVVMTWAGGAQAISTADWTPLHGRTVDIWPDADEPGRKAGTDLAGLLFPHCPKVRLVDTSDAPSEGWDIADAIAEGMTADQVKEWGRARIKTVDMAADAPAAKVPRGTSKAAAKHPVDDGTLDQPAYVLWEQLQLARNDRGPFATEANALRIITAHSTYAGRIWLDEFSQKLMIDDDPGPARQFSRTDAIQCLIWMQSSLLLPKMPLSAVERAACVVGEQNKRHPVKDYLGPLEWDGTDYLSQLLPIGFGAADNAYTRAVGRCWLNAMVARIYQPGCKADNVPVFEGAQGIHKSSALSALGGPWFLETTENPIKNRKDFLLSMQGKWLIEIPEIDRIGGKYGDLQDLTGIITIRNDTYRVPYGATTMDYPRQSIFAGTANRSSQWQPDETGGRRYWPVICGVLNLAWLIEHRDQLFAQAMHLYRSGASWWDVPEAEAREQQEARRVVDEWEEIIAQFFTHEPHRDEHKAWWSQRIVALQFVTVADIMEKALNMPERTWDMASQKRVVKAMTALGLVKQRPTIDGKRVWVYARPNTIAAAGIKSTPDW